MRQEAIYPFKFENAGIKEMNYNDFSEDQKSKYEFINDYVSLMIKVSDCGWGGCRYIVYDNNTEIVFFIDKHGNISRGVNVTWDSKIGMLHDIFENID